MSSAVRFSPITRLRNSAASAGVNRKSTARSFGQLAADAQASEWEWWILAGGDDQVHLPGQVLEQEGQGLIDWLGLNHVVVVQDEDEIVRDGGDFIEQGCQNRFG